MKRKAASAHVLIHIHLDPLMLATDVQVVYRLHCLSHAKQVTTCEENIRSQAEELAQEK